MRKFDFGLIGLAVMGQNLVLNIESRGYSVAVFNRTASRTDEFVKQRTGGKNIGAFYEMGSFVKNIKKPRKIMIMVKAGKPVDLTIEKLLPFLDEGDLIIDGGNSHFTDTRRRFDYLSSKGILFLGTGVSGGEEGALKGPSIMPGGSEEAYDLVKDIFIDISAKVDGVPCCTYIGNRDAGHFVKMVHNGIEYAEMQIIAEAYSFVRKGMKLSLDEIRLHFNEWKEGDLSSFLFDITTDILGAVDPDTDKPMLDVILDVARQKGTGRWTSLAALDLGVPLSIIDSGVFARNISEMKEEREEASRFFDNPSAHPRINKEKMVRAVHDAILATRISSYAQGMAMLRKASEEYEFELNLDEIAQIWKGGCIIRAAILEPIRRAFAQNPGLVNLYLDDYFREVIKKSVKGWRKFVSTAVTLGIPVPAASSALAYFDAYRSARLPANMIQAQRDYFGAHTYERIDGEGKFHSQWNDLVKPLENTTVSGE